MKPAVFRDLHDLTGSLAITGIQPITLEWSDLPTGRSWKIHVRTCADLAKLTTAWHGRRADKPPWSGTQNRYADVGPEGLIQHVCRTDLPCWEAGPSDYDGDLFGGAA